MKQSIPGPTPIHDRVPEKLTCVVFHDGSPVRQPISFDRLSDVLEEAGNIVWFDAVDPDEQDLALLQEEFGLHPLAIEDAVVAHQRPKIEAYGNHWFLVVQAVMLRDDKITFHEIAIFSGQQFVVTVRHTPAFPLQEVEQRWLTHPDELKHDAGFLLYTILDTIVDSYVPVAEDFQDRVDGLEEQLFSADHVGGGVLPRIFEMKKTAQRFRHAALPMREILTPLIRQDLKLYPPDVGLYFRDVYDHAVLMIDRLDSMRDLVNSALEVHLSLIANRQNEVAKQLTMIATFFLPLSFIVGFFGQNFSWLVYHIGGGVTFWLLGMGVEVAAVVITFATLKLRGWF